MQITPCWKADLSVKTVITLVNSSAILATPPLLSCSDMFKLSLYQVLNLSQNGYCFSLT